MRYRYLGSVRDHRKFDSRRPNGRRRITRSRNMPVYTYTTIDEPRANFRTDPTAINDAGAIVGTYADLTGNHGFLYSGGTYATLDAPGATQTRASGINASGLIVGDYFDGASQGHGFLY